MLDVVIRGGEVVDGTGTPRQRGDVGVRDGRIVAVGQVDEPARRVVDADGLVVSPGFIDPHTHYDAQVFWDPHLTPSCLHGVTTMLAGNCGFTIAPMEDQHADYIRRMLAVVEGMPLAALEAGPTWDWRSYAEWLAAVEASGPAVNVGFGVGHSTIRRMVMGEASHEPTATPEQVTAMVRLVHESIEAGALAFTTSLSTAHHDGDGRPVPSFAASLDELVALSTAVRAHPGTTLGLSPPIGVWETPILELLTAMSRAADRPLFWNALIIDADNPEQTWSQMAAGDHSRARGGAVVAETIPDLMSMRLSFETGFVLAAIPGWGEVLALPHGERLEALADTSVRARLRASYEAMPDSSLKRVMKTEDIRLGEATSPGTERFAHRLVGEVASELGVDPFDAMLDVIVANDLRTPIWPRAVGDDDETWQLRSELWQDPRVVFGGGDGGAHLDLASTYQYFTALLGPHVRDKHLMSLEQAVHLMTGEPASAFGLTGRGVVAPGAHADLTLFDPDTIGPGDLHLRPDLPSGAERLYSVATGITSVLVEGVEVVHDGLLVGNRPGRVLKAGIDTHTVTCADYWRKADERAHKGE